MMIVLIINMVIPSPSAEVSRRQNDYNNLSDDDDHDNLDDDSVDVCRRLQTSEDVKMILII